MVACTQFMNIIVHSVENVNYRVHLQYELTSLGLDDFLETLKDNESERLITQVHIMTLIWLDSCIVRTTPYKIDSYGLAFISMIALASKYY